MNVYFTGTLYPARIIIDNGSGSNGENPGKNPNPGDNKGNATMVISKSTTLTPEMLAGILFLFITVTKENITITLPSLPNTGKGTAINIYTTFTTQGNINITTDSNSLNGPFGLPVNNISIRKQESLLLNYNGLSWDIANYNQESASNNNNSNNSNNGVTTVKLISGRNRVNDFYWGGERK